MPDSHTVVDSQDSWDNEFLEFLEINKGRLYGMAKRLTGSQSAIDPDDVVQEALIKFWEKHRTKPLSEHTNLLSFMNQGIRWAFINLMRKASKSMPFQEQVEREEQPCEIEASSIFAIFFEEIVELSVLRLEDILRRLRSCIDQLAKIEKRCIELLYIEGMSNKDAAEKLACSPSNITQAEKRAINKLRNCISKVYTDPLSF